MFGQSVEMGLPELESSIKSSTSFYSVSRFISGNGKLLDRVYVITFAVIQCFTRMAESFFHELNYQKMIRGKCISRRA